LSILCEIPNPKIKKVFPILIPVTRRMIGYLILVGKYVTGIRRYKEGFRPYNV